jgi:hypothetical protein
MRGGSEISAPPRIRPHPLAAERPIGGARAARRQPGGALRAGESA